LSTTGCERHAGETFSGSEIADKSLKKLAALLFRRRRWSISKSEKALWKKEEIQSSLHEMASTARQHMVRNSPNGDVIRFS
jgi:hypothetical protein